MCAGVFPTLHFLGQSRILWFARCLSILHAYKWAGRKKLVFVEETIVKQNNTNQNR